jgi:hypothetical protein
MLPNHMLAELRCAHGPMPVHRVCVCLDVVVVIAVRVLVVVVVIVVDVVVVVAVVCWSRALLVSMWTCVPLFLMVSSPEGHVPTLMSHTVHGFIVQGHCPQASYLANGCHIGACKLLFMSPPPHPHRRRPP